MVIVERRGESQLLRGHGVRNLASPLASCGVILCDKQPRPTLVSSRVLTLGSGDAARPILGATSYFAGFVDGGSIMRTFCIMYISSLVSQCHFHVTLGAGNSGNYLIHGWPAVEMGQLPLAAATLILPLLV